MLYGWTHILLDPQKTHQHRLGKYLNIIKTNEKLPHTGKTGEKWYRREDYGMETLSV
jgi:hypothetical protein